MVQVFDDVELDAALAQDLQYAARLSSAGGVVDGQSVHLGVSPVREVESIESGSG